MSSETSSGYLTVNSSGQVAYVLDVSNLGLAQVQIAVPTSEVILIQDENKSPTVSAANDSIVVEVEENVNLLGNNLIILVSQAQGVMVVGDEVAINSNLRQQSGEQKNDGTTGILPCVEAQFITDMNIDEDEEFSNLLPEIPPITIEDAHGWYQDSLTTVSALDVLFEYIQSQDIAKEEDDAEEKEE